MHKLSQRQESGSPTNFSKSSTSAQAYLLQGGVGDTVASQLQSVQVGVQRRQQGAVCGGVGGAEWRQGVDQVAPLGLLQSSLRYVSLHEGLELGVVDALRVLVLLLQRERC